MRQKTISEEGFEKHRKKTRREQFLEDMDQIIPWADLAAVSPFGIMEPTGFRHKGASEFSAYWSQ